MGVRPDVERRPDRLRPELHVDPGAAAREAGDDSVAVGRGVTGLCGPSSCCPSMRLPKGKTKKHRKRTKGFRACGWSTASPRSVGRAPGTRQMRERAWRARVALAYASNVHVLFLFGKGN